MCRASPSLELDERSLQHHTARVKLSAPKKRILIWLLCAVLVMLRVGGGHIHVCLDGSEPPVSIHALDDGLHHHADVAQSAHEDRNVSFSDGFLKYSATLALAAIAGAILLFLVTDSPPFWFARSTTTIIASARPFLLRPPLRGPPA